MDKSQEGDRLVESIPDPQTVREHLAQKLRDAELLRRLLRLAERAASNRELRKEGDDVR